jgi:DNA replication and repair protein RecF
MHLRHLEAREFRNWERLALELPKGTVVVHGPNGAGKTSLLEAICVAARGESHRARTTEELVRSGCDHGFIRAQFAGEGRETGIDVGLARAGQRRIRLNGVVRRRADLIGRAPLVLFWAEDVVVVGGEPAGRRRLLDRELSAISRRYYFSLMRYRRAVEQRNRLLRRVREGAAEESALDAWDRGAARYGAWVMLARREFLSMLGPVAARAYGSITGDGRPLVVEYRPSIAMPTEQNPAAVGKERGALAEELAKALREGLEKQRRADVGYGTTSCGPHRDDMELLLGDQSVRVFGSQGEQRSSAVAMRMGLAAVVREMTGERPLLLLDDVLSELDERHRAGVFAACADVEQVIITCCDPLDIPEEARRSAAAFEVADGRVLEAR